MLKGVRLRRRGALLAVLACLATVGLTISATAATKVTGLTSCQHHILSSGKYRLEANVVGRDTCFQFDAAGVTLSLNGHTITNAEGAAKDGAAIRTIGSGAKIVGPGTISGFDYGISLTAHGHNTVRGVTVTRNVFGIAVTSEHNIVRDNVAKDNAINGIQVNPGVSGNKIVANHAHLNGGFDLKNNQGNCDRNVWRANSFGTANEPCIH